MDLRGKIWQIYSKILHAEEINEASSFKQADHKPGRVTGLSCITLKKNIEKIMNIQ